ncbi:MAG: hypothetical protein JOS17DRAFT_394215 [Linnemannia elongata]|nr:MAG: hypothetical protein JOS17DRAFT_394215 [Linnemannia elongata]
MIFYVFLQSIENLFPSGVLRGVRTCKEWERVLISLPYSQSTIHSYPFFLSLPHHPSTPRPSLHFFLLSLSPFFLGFIRPPRLYTGTSHFSTPPTRYDFFFLLLSLIHGSGALACLDFLSLPSSFPLSPSLSRNT